MTRSRQTLILVAVAVMVLGLAGWAGYAYWQRTPQYAVFQIAKAVQSHDVALFHEYVDVNTFVSRFMDAAMESVTANKASGDPYSTLGDGLARGLIGLMKPRLVEMAKEQLDKAIESGDFSVKDSRQASPLAILAQLYSPMGSSQDVQVTGTEIQGKIAMVHVQRQAGPLVDIKFRKKESGHWELIELANAATLLQSEAKRTVAVDTASAPPQPTATLRNFPPAMQAMGKVLYEGKGTCFACHGRGGRGDGTAGITLNPRPTDFTKPASFKMHTDEEWYNAIVNGVPGTGMVPIAPATGLSNDEIWAIIAYVRSFRKA